MTVRRGYAAGRGRADRELIVEPVFMAEQEDNDDEQLVACLHLLPLLQLSTRERKMATS